MVRKIIDIANVRRNDTLRGGVSRWSARRSPFQPAEDSQDEEEERSDLAPQITHEVDDQGEEDAVDDLRSSRVSGGDKNRVREEWPTLYGMSQSMEANASAEGW